MARWGSSLIAVAGIVFAALPLCCAQAGEAERQSELLQLDGPIVARTVLAEENLQGRGLPAQGTFGAPFDVGVVLWDELRQGQPAPPGPGPGVNGHGGVTVSAASN